MHKRDHSHLDGRLYTHHQWVAPPALAATTKTGARHQVYHLPHSNVGVLLDHVESATDDLILDALHAKVQETGAAEPSTRLVPVNDTIPMNDIEPAAGPLYNFGATDDED